MALGTFWNRLVNFCTESDHLQNREATKLLYADTVSQSQKAWLSCENKQPVTMCLPLTACFFSLMLRVHHDHIRVHIVTLGPTYLSQYCQPPGRGKSTTYWLIKLVPRSPTRQLFPPFTGQGKSHGQSWVQPGRKVLSSWRDGNYGKETGICGKQKYNRLQLLWKKGCRYQVRVSSTKNNDSTPSHRGGTLPRNLSLPNIPDSHYQLTKVGKWDNKYLPTLLSIVK